MNTPQTILLDDGSGGKASQRLIQNLFFRHFSNPLLDVMDDAALLHISGPIAMSTDGYTVDPVEFPGGNIGSLAVHGTVNDVSMLGAEPLYLACAFILEEGLELALLERVVASMAQAAQKAGVLIVTGDTKVVPRGAADKIFITTTGLGRVYATHPPSGHRACPGDAVLVSGTLGDHGLAVLAKRQGLSLEAGVESDSAALNHMVKALMGGVPDIHVLRDPTRGGFATTLNEIAEQSGVTITVQEAALPVRAGVRDGCAVLGLDPLYLANEGKLICILPADQAEAALAIMRQFSEGRDAALVALVGQGHDRKDIAAFVRGTAYAPAVQPGIGAATGSETGLATGSVAGSQPKPQSSPNPDVALLHSPHVHTGKNTVHDIVKAEPAMLDHNAGEAVCTTASVVKKDGFVLLETPLGGRRLLGMLEGEQLPRIC